MTGQTVQKWIFALATLALFPMLFDVLTFKIEDTADLEKLQNWRGGANPEDQPGYLLDGPPIPYDARPTGVPKQYPVSKNAPEEDIPTIDLSGGSADEEEGVTTINLSGDEDVSSGIEKEKPAAKKPKPKPAPKPQTAARPAADPCSRLSGKKGWVIQDNAFSSKEYAAARVADLKAKGVAATSTARSCFEAGKSGYIVWLGSIQSSESAAEKTAADLEKKLQRAGLRKGKLLLRRLP